jgi:hypothetical protein
MVGHGSSRMVGYGSSRMVGYGLSSMEGHGSSRMEGHDSSSMVLFDFSCAYILRDTATVTKISPQSHIINVNYPSTMMAWCKLKGIKIEGGRIRLWKTTNADGKDFYSGTILYDTKKEIIDPKWDKKYNGECGYGLHLADSPSSARIFSKKNFRLFQISVAIKDCVCFAGLPDYPMKIRARACRMIKEYPADYIEAR